jgi:Ca2+-binding RTX toxin-like protein
LILYGCYLLKNLSLQNHFKNKEFIMAKKIHTTLESSLKSAANHGDLKSITTIVNSMTPADQISIKSNVYNRVLLSMADHSTQSSDPATDSLVTATTRNFMQRVGELVDNRAIGKAMETLAWDHNFTALNSIVDNLTTAQKASIPTRYLDHSLEWISKFTFSDGTDTDATTALAMRDFMSKLGPYISGEAIGEAMVRLTRDHNFDALDAALDFVTDSQKESIDSSDIDKMLVRIADFTFAPEADADATTETVLHDFMKELGAYAGNDAISKAMDTLTTDGNLGALRAITDNLTPAQKADIDIDSDHSGSTLNSIIDSTSEAGGTESDDISNNAIHDSMGKLGNNVDKSELADAVHNHNLEGVAAIPDNGSDQKALHTQDENQCLLNDTETLTEANDSHTGTDAKDGSDEIMGSNGEDQLYGGTASDLLYGDAGNDVLSGGAGNDSLTGGLGADRFVFESSSTGVDTVLDFAPDQGDMLDFSSLLTNFDPVTQAITDFVSKTTVDGSTTISVDVDGTGAGAAVAVVTLQNVADIDIQAQFNQNHIIA